MSAPAGQAAANLTRQLEDHLPLLGAAGLMLGAGGIHVAIAPSHFLHAPAHGMTFGLLGLLQLGWVGALAGLAWPAWRQRPGFIVGLRRVGLLVSGGAWVLWLCTQAWRPPFGYWPEPIDGATVLSKIAELVTALLLLADGPLSEAAPPSLAIRRRWRRIAGFSAAGAAIWGLGFVAEWAFPDLALLTERKHEHLKDDREVERIPGYGELIAASTRLVIALLQRDPYAWQLPPGFPTPRVPADNPMTQAKVELGRHLFYDRRLSGLANQSCASCHRQDLAFADGKTTAVGSTGEEHPRNSMALVNVAYNAALTWGHPTLDEIERQVRIPMFGREPIELGIAGHEAEVLARFAEDPLYQRLFAEAFPEVVGPITWEMIIKALACFTRSLISGGSAYDRFAFGGDQGALSESARRGLEMFFSEDFECHHCHGGFNFTVATRHKTTTFVENVFHNTGLYDLGEGAYPRGNRGVFEITQKSTDMGKFRPPTLRNVELTAPYMHDGSIATLEEVIDTYAAGGRNIPSGPYAGDGRKNPHKSGFVPGFRLSPQEKADLIAFLRSLTDPTFVQDPRFSDPFAQKKGASG